MSVFFGALPNPRILMEISFIIEMINRGRRKQKQRWIEKDPRGSEGSPSPPVLGA